MKVEDFGAVGDGVTDDTAAFKAYVAHVEKHDSKWINVLDGKTYLLKDEITLPFGVGIRIVVDNKFIGLPIRFGTVTNISEYKYGLEISGKLSVDSKVLELWLDDTWLDEMYTQKERKQLCKKLGHFWRKNNRSSHRKSQICIRCGKKKRNP